ncbi:MAG TPA: hypothetical protein VEM95_06005 [Thermoplasmata archaeon]|nr:hypothetical protein [Thermoplasmata archaeon]
MDLRKVRRDAEVFVRAVSKEFYENWSGLKAEMDTASIYARHADLFAPALLEDLRARRAKAEGDEARRLRLLQSSLTEEALQHAVTTYSDRRATEEATRQVQVDGTSIPYRLAAVTQQNEDDRARRGRIFRARMEVVRELNGILVDRWNVLHTFAMDLGYDHYAHLFADVKGIDFNHLQAILERFLAQTDSLYVESMNRILKPQGLTVDAAEAHDVNYAFRGKAFDAHFRKEEAVPVLRRTLKGLGFDLDRQPNIRLDVEERPSKSPRAFCSTLAVPDDIVLVLMPHGGHDDFSTILHEAGHAEHFGNTAKKLPFEYRYLGDNSVTEGWAFVLEYITLDPAWLRAQVGFEDASAFLDFTYTYKLFFLRRYAAKLNYELRLHTKGVEGMDATYAAELGKVLKFHIPPEQYLVDLDDGFYAAQYLRAWIFDAQMRAALREEHGDAWWSTTEAGAFLKRQWSTGQKYGVEELLEGVGYAGLDLDPFVEELESRLAP